ncbi:MAG: CaiB/BaiF CoA transferase family protein [Promethearchaeota archaeon]
MSDTKFPLDGIVCFDFARVLAAPLVGTLLADFGAEVIKVELPGGGPSVKRGRNVFDAIHNRNKKSVTLDLHANEGQEIAKKLCKKADAVIFNFRPGVLEKWNMGAETLLEINPNLIICLVSGYGQTGPNRRKPGYDRTISAYIGITNNSGYPEHPPVRTGYPLIDYMTGYLGAFSVVMALYNRDVKNNGGEIIDLSLAETALRATASSLAFLKEGYVTKRAGNRIPFVVPAENFETQDGRYVSINANSGKIWRRLVTAMNREDLLTSKQFGKYSARLRNQDKLYKIMGDWVKNYTTEEITDLLVKAEVPVEMVRNIAEVAADLHLLSRNSVLAFNDQKFGKVTMPGIVPKLKKFPGKVRNLSSAPGKHNNEIYRRFLGLSDEKIKKLEEKGII